MTPIYDLRKQLEYYFLGALIVITIFYGLWRAYPLLAGPHITINTPKDGSMVASTTFVISGKVSRVKNIEIQGRPIPIDKDGNPLGCVSWYPKAVITHWMELPPHPVC